MEILGRADGKRDPMGKVVTEWLRTNKVTDLISATFFELDLRNVVFEDAQLEQAKFHGCILIGAQFGRAKLFDSEFVHCDLGGAGFEDANADLVLFNGCELNGARLRLASLEKTEFLDCRCIGAEFLQVNAVEVFLHSCDVSKAQFQGAEMSRASIARCNLRETNFSNTILKNASFEDVDVDSLTRFQNLQSVDRCVIERAMLLSLGENAGLTRGNLSRMVVRDDVARLRSQFGGFWTVIILGSMATFLFPYCWFVIERWTIASFSPNGKATVPLWLALLRFIWSGGKRWRDGWTFDFLSFTSFVWVLLYNVARGVLLWKTKSLEMREAITGIPVNFSVDTVQGKIRIGKRKVKWKPWKFLLNVVRFGLWFTIAAILWNTFNFLQMRVPV